jgi:hypothetical protein
MTINNGYISVPFAYDASTFIQTGLNNIANTLPGWQPREGNLEVLLLEQFAMMTAEAAAVAAQVPVAIFEYYGNLIGITQGIGSTMNITTTWTLASGTSQPTTISAGTAASISINGVTYTFTTDVDLIINPSVVSSGSVTMTAATAGSSYNVISSGSYLTPTYSTFQVASVQITSINISGADAETTSTYLNRLSNALTVYTSRPITTNDYATLASTVSGVNRTTAVNQVNPSVNVLSASQGVPTTASWSALGGATVAASTSPIGVQFTTPSSPANFASASTSISVGSTFLPLITTTTTGAMPATSGAVNVTSATSWGSSGYGFAVATSGAIIGFSYSAKTTTSVTITSYSSSATFASTNVLIAYAGPATGFYPTGLDPLSAGANAGAGVGLTLTGSTRAEGVIIIGTSATASNIGYTISPTGFSYTSGATISITSGITTSVTTFNGNGINAVATASLLTSSTAAGADPSIVAVVYYQYQSTPYVYVSDTAATSDYTSSSSAVGQNLSVIIPGKSPVTVTSINDISVLKEGFHSNIANVTINIYNATSVSSHVAIVPYVALYQSNKNFSYKHNGAWYTQDGITPVPTTANPGNLLPDAQFKSLTNPSTTFSFGYSMTGPTTPSLTSTAGWPATGGAGYFVDNSSTPITHYFTYASISGPVLNGFNFTPVSGAVTANSNIITSYSPPTTPVSWAFSSPTGSGTFQALISGGIQLTPSANPTTAEASATSQIFTLYGGTSYIIDFWLDSTNVTSVGVGTTTPRVVLYANTSTTPSFSAVSTQAMATGYGAKQRMTTVYSPSTNCDVYLKVDFPSGMTATGQVAFSGIQVLPAIGSLSGATAYTAPGIIDAVGFVSPGPMWKAPTSGVNTGYEKYVTVIAADTNGMYPGTSVIQATQNYLSNYREINFNPYTVGPCYQVIDVTYNVIAVRGYNQATVQNAILNSLLTYISPKTWATNNTGSEVWDPSQTTVYYLNVVGTIDDADGVSNVVSVTIATRPSLTSGSESYVTSDIQLSGTGVLPILGNVTGTISLSSSSVYEISSR